MDSVVEQAEVIARRKSLEHQFREKLSSLIPGSRIKIRFNIREPVSQEVLDQFTTDLAEAYGDVEVKEFVANPSRLWVTLTVPRDIANPEWWTLLIVVIPAAIIAGMIAWGIIGFFESLAKNLVPIAIIAGLTCVTIVVVKSKRA